MYEFKWSNQLADYAISPASSNIESRINPGLRAMQAIGELSAIRPIHMEIFHEKAMTSPTLPNAHDNAARDDTTNTTSKRTTQPENACTVKTLT